MKKKHYICGKQIGNPVNPVKFGNCRATVIPETEKSDPCCSLNKNAFSTLLLWKPAAKIQFFLWLCKKLRFFVVSLHHEFKNH